MNCILLIKKLVKRYRKAILLAIVSAITVAFFANRWIYMYSTDGYVLPQNADDWASWGTWISGLVTAAAFYLTLQQIRNEQRKQQQEQGRANRKLLTNASYVTVRATHIENNTYFGIPRSSSEAQLFQGSKSLITINNGTTETISNIQIGFKTALAKPAPQGSLPPEHPVKPAGIHEQKWLTMTSSDKHWANRSKVDPISTSHQILSKGDSDADMIHMEFLGSNKKSEFFIVLESADEKNSLSWFSFTDGQGNEWRKNISKGKDMFMVSDA